MKRQHACKIVLAVALAWAVPTWAVAKSGAVALPDRNPDRPSADPGIENAADATVAPAAAPNLTTATKARQPANNASTITAEAQLDAEPEQVAAQPAADEASKTAAGATDDANSDDKAPSSEDKEKPTLWPSASL